MKNRIKKIIRTNLPETNSSSSHSVSICMSNQLLKPGDPEFDLEIEDGILYIPLHDEFGWDYFKSNSVLEKLQYVCGIYCYDPNSASGQKQIVKLKKILIGYLGVKDVCFRWIDDYVERKKNCEDPEDCYYEYPEINHNSHDIFEEITETKETILNFIFNPGSWLYGGNDNSEPPKGFYTETEVTDSEPDAIASVYFPNPLGRIDFEIPRFPSHHSVFDEIARRDEDDILKHISVNLETGKVDLLDRGDYFNRRYKVGGQEQGKNEILTFSESASLVDPDGTQYVMYVSDKFNTCILNEFSIRKANDDADLSYRSIIEHIIASGEIEEGKDYMRFPMEVRYLKLDIVI